MSRAGSRSRKVSPSSASTSVLSRGVKGQGITIGALSDSYNLATTDVFGDPLTIHAAARREVRRPAWAWQPGELQARRGPAGRPGGLDEGRAMLQIAHDVAPKVEAVLRDGARAGWSTSPTTCSASANPNGRLPCQRRGRRHHLLGRADVGRLDPDRRHRLGCRAAVSTTSARPATRVSRTPGSRAVRFAAQVGCQPTPTSTSATSTCGSLRRRAAGRRPGTGHGRGADPERWARAAAGSTCSGMTRSTRTASTLGFAVLHGHRATSPRRTRHRRSRSRRRRPSSARSVQFRADAIPSGTTDLILTVTAPDGTNLGTIDTGSSPEVLTHEAESGRSLHDHGRGFRRRHR